MRINSGATMQLVTVGAEVKLVETLATLKEQPTGWQGIWFGFAELMEQYKSEYQIKIAINMVKDLLKNEEGSLYLCKDSTLFVVTHNTPRQQLEKVVFQLRYLFMDDPLAYTDDGEENPAFSTMFDFASEFDGFASLARGKMLEGKRGGVKALPAQARQAAPVKEASAPSAGGFLQQVKQIASVGSMRFLNATNLAHMERDLANADLTTVMRRQPVCAAIPDMMVRRVFDELYINITHLRQMMRVEADLLSNRWLFKYLTELLDYRVLHMIQKNPSRYMELPISLNLNVKTLLSDEFLEFDASIKPSVKVSVVVELQISDVFEDMRAFIIARNSVQKLGYRVCLDGLTDLSFTQVDREKLGFDLVKLQWNADIPSDLQTRENKKIADMIKACGPNRVILNRCDNRKAVDYGQALGISLFQGRYLDKLMNPLAKIEN
jgi:EAL domain-containing protein (putative c-di-GMP-specific phosphodiesterase class I)